MELLPGMILSNEPGYYKTGGYGIRIENLVLVEEREIDGSEGEWVAAYLRIFGEEVEGVVKQCPETASALRQTPGGTSFGTTFFSALEPGTFLAPHHGDTNAKLRCQMPLIKTEACRVKVADIEIEPKEGKCLIFDDSFLHSAWNEGDTVLYVLDFDFFHPDLSDDEIEYLSALSSEPYL